MGTSSLNLNYYYGSEADQFTFLRIPKTLITDERYKGLSSDAKLLYGLLLDRMSLSRKNNWLDQNNRVYIVYSIEEIMSDLCCSKPTVIKMMKELDSKTGLGLIEKIRRGLGKPDIIYVKNFSSSPAHTEKNEPDSQKLQKSKFLTSGSKVSLPHEVKEFYPNNTNKINTYLNNPLPLVSPSDSVTPDSEDEDRDQIVQNNFEDVRTAVREACESVNDSAYPDIAPDLAEIICNELVPGNTTKISANALPVEKLVDLIRSHKQNISKAASETVRKFKKKSEKEPCMRPDRYLLSLFINELRFGHLSKKHSPAKRGMERDEDLDAKLLDMLSARLSTVYAAT